MSVYDTDIQDAIEKEEGFIGKGGFGGEEDNTKDVVVMANDLCSSMIQNIIIKVPQDYDVSSATPCYLFILFMLCPYIRSLSVMLSRISFHVLYGSGEEGEQCGVLFTLARNGSQQSRGPSRGYSYPVCTTCGRRHQGECRRAAGTCFKYGQAGHLQKDCKKNTTAVTPGQADKKPGASGHVFAITEGHASNTS
nr:hypothetical protein [Tanacetum cinerariifolium]